jgi:hypothetical protein
MVPLTALWLPIVVAAIAVFIVSSITHMVLKYHNSDYQKHPREDDLRAALRGVDLAPGNYAFPRAMSSKEMGSPEMMEKFKEGPVGFMNIIPDGPPAMGKSLGQWFAYCLVMGVFVAYIAGRALTPGTDYLAVFRIVGAVAFVGYGLGNAVDSIWKAQVWSTTAKHTFDGLLYALVTAGVFGWLWPN